MRIALYTLGCKLNQAERLPDAEVDAPRSRIGEIDRVYLRRWRGDRGEGVLG